MIDLILKENESKELEKLLTAETDKSVRHFERELATLRTGRAHTSLVENLIVLAYGGTPTPLKSLAALSVPESRLIVVQPWDIATIGEIEKAISTSELGITPINDGKIIRLQLPEITKARREELSKQVGKKLEECRIAIRNVRKDFNNLVRDAERSKAISENFSNRLSDVIQKIIDGKIAEAESLAAKKEQELKTV